MRIGPTLAASRRLALGPRLILENAAVDELVVVTGPPGAGKSSVSEELAKRWKWHFPLLAYLTKQGTPHQHQLLRMVRVVGVSARPHRPGTPMTPRLPMA
jgi:hypothetical protein